MERNDFSTLAAFLAVAEERSFTRAAKRHGVSPSAMSHAIRDSKRTSGCACSRARRAASRRPNGGATSNPLAPGSHRCAGSSGPALGIAQQGCGPPAIVGPRLAGTELLAPKLAQFTRDYPDVVLDITADDTRIDIVAGGFDAGIHFGEYIQKDMIAVRVSKDHRAAIVGSPAYFKSHAKPKAPRTCSVSDALIFATGTAATFIDGSSKRAENPYQLQPMGL